MRVNDGEGVVTLSKKRLDAIQELGRDRDCQGREDHC